MTPQFLCRAAGGCWLILLSMVPSSTRAFGDDQTRAHASSSLSVNRSELT